MTSVFATFDKNGDGLITKQELRESLKNIQISATEKEAEEMVVKVDSNGDGVIDMEEFKILYRNMTAGCGKEGEARDPMVAEELKEAFEVFDGDKDGLITVEELGSVLSSLGMKEGKKMEDCKEMIRRVDVDGDGMVNFDEFKTMMMRNGGRLLSSV
ncbi:Calmodulin-like protein 5 [Linum perenne]